MPVIVGTADPDTLIGTAGEDYIYGFEGNDTIDAGSGVDTIDAGQGDDSIYGRDGNDLIDAASGNDLVEGGAGNDTIYGRDGNDSLYGGDQDDVLEDGAGNDTVFGGNGSDSMFGSAGDDYYDGGASLPGSDSIDYRNALAGIYVDLRLSTGQVRSLAGGDLAGVGVDTLVNLEVFWGSNFNDVIKGTHTTRERDNIHGGAGDDRIFGFGYYDTLWGDAGNDYLDGGTFEDVMYGGQGDDTFVVDAAGDDVFETTGEGFDTVRSSATFTLGLGQEIESLVLTGSAAINATGNEYDNRLVGNSAANAIDGGAGADVMRGGGGNDTYYVDNAGDRVIENAGEGRDDVISSINFSLRAHVDDLVLTGSAVRGNGNSLDNAIVGNAGNNIINGGSGADVMIGGSGNDTYYVDDSGDQIVENSGAGTDRVYTTITMALGGEVEQLFMRGSGAINATGNALDNVLRGNAAANVLNGAGGADDLRGGEANDTFVFAQGDFGGLSPSTADRIIDFNQAEGDLIDLAGVDATNAIAGDQAFTFIGTSGFTGSAGQLRYQQLNGNTYVYGDRNGDGVADLMIRLDGTHSLIEGDFIL